MNIGILFGGKSFEHDISIISAYQLKKKIDGDYNVHLLYLDIDNNLYIADKLKIKDFKENNIKKLKKTRFIKKGVKGLNIDLIVGVMHGENGEDGLAYSLCNFYDIPYLGCEVFAGSLAIDKLYTYQFLANNGIDMIESTGYDYEDYLNSKDIPFMPCIIKPARGGSSIGITVCHKKEELDDKLLRAFDYADRLVIQPFYEGIKEYNLALNECDYSNIEAINKKDDIFSFENKYTDSFKQMHQTLIDDSRYEEFCDIGRKVYKLLDCKGIIRIDFFIVDDKIIVNEVNTTPGALAMYLFSDFKKVFEGSIKELFKIEKRVYNRGDFLVKSQIDK